VLRAFDWDLPVLIESAALRKVFQVGLEVCPVRDPTKER
jgi:hypothetical protein